VAAVFAAQLALNYPSFADVCVKIRIYLRKLAGQIYAYFLFFLVVKMMIL